MIIIDLQIYQTTFYIHVCVCVWASSSSSSYTDGICPNYPSLLVGLLDDNQCQYRVDVSFSCSSTMMRQYELSIGERWWVYPFFSSSTHHVLFVFFFEWLFRWEKDSRPVAVLWCVACRICSKQHKRFLSSSYLAFSLSVLVSVCMVHSCSSMDTTTALKKSHFILSGWSDFANLSTVFDTFPRYTLKSLLVDERFLPRYVTRSTSFKAT